MTTHFFHPSLLLLFLVPGSEIWDPGWVKIRIRDKHPGSANIGKKCQIFAAKKIRNQIKKDPNPKPDLDPNRPQKFRIRSAVTKFRSVLGIRDILVRIRGSAPLTHGSGSNFGSNSFLQ
jgi:hypothetical protein